MVGGGNSNSSSSSRKDEGINSTNVFAALETLRKKKNKDHGSSKPKGSSKGQPKAPEAQVYWAPAPLKAKLWADVGDEDDDDYFASAAPPLVWGTTDKVLRQNEETTAQLESFQESESEDEGIDDDVEDEHEHETETEVLAQTEIIVKPSPQAALATKETERQLSKKELKKKELAELEAVLAELGMSKKEENDQNALHGVTEEMKSEELNGNAEKKENAPAESKNAKKKKKKSVKEAKDQDQPNGSGTTTEVPDEAAGADQAEEDASGVDVKERLKKMASMRKKKTNKEMDGAARAAAIEAAARSARLAVAKKKEKNHYNQQPVR